MLISFCFVFFVQRPASHISYLFCCRSSEVPNNQRHRADHYSQTPNGVCDFRPKVAHLEKKSDVNSYTQNGHLWEEISCCELWVTGHHDEAKQFTFSRRYHCSHGYFKYFYWVSSTCSHLHILNSSFNSKPVKHGFFS